MKFAKHLYSGLQGFCLGAILMAYITDYNTSQLLIAIMCIAISILLRINSKNK